MTRTFVVVEMIGRDLARRRAVLALLALVPLAFYLIRRGENPGQAIRLAGLGLAWAVSTAALFTSNAAGPVEARLRLTGFRPRHLFLGRLAALYGVGLLLGLLYLGVIVVDQAPQRPWAVAVGLALTLLVAAPLGLCIGAIAPRDLEGTLILITLTAMQFLVDPDQRYARALPFWSTREVTTYAVEPVSNAYLHRGLAHAGIYTAVLLMVTGALVAVRLRRRRHLDLAGTPAPPVAAVRG
jgi:hypothetical protein